MAKLFGVITSAVLLVLILKAGGDWWLIAILVGGWIVVYALITHPSILMAIVQMRRDRYEYKLREAQSRRDFTVNMAEQRRLQVTAVAKEEHYGALRDHHARQIEVRAQAAAEALPVEDEFDEFVWRQVMEAYAHCADNGKVEFGIICKAATTGAGFTEAQHREFKKRIIDAGIARFDKQAWYLNLDTCRDAKVAYERLTGRRWRGEE